ncbi:PEP-utilizing enzyme [Pararhizobium sp. BT-229]|uniref:putative PEP-binding protein n=1 Tax=Pararhizobium sp. BT-229 TaxID=2986923 RepID=UPI0021F69FF8|nr:putative PEP-binding protein [Pararhizobium sp. BT-229]MCV9966620.1 PEP-utilizing enzyme [Pararhizobium sp. BT-229]
MSGALRLEGKGNGCGYATGPAFVSAEPLSPCGDQISPSLEFEHLSKAIEESIAALEALIARTEPLSADILEFQIEMLRDPAIAEMAAEEIAKGQNAAFSWVAALEEYIAGFEQSEDDDIRARAVDMIDIRDRVLRALEGAPSIDFPAGSVFIGKDMAPSLFLAHDWTGGGGIVLEAGSTASHVALLARAKGVAMVVGVGSFSLESKTPVLVDGDNGFVIVHPGGADLAMAYRATKATPRHGLEARDSGVALNGAVEVLVNISDIDEIHSLDSAACEGIGLLRTEFLLSHAADLANEEKQFQLYSEMLKWAAGKPVTIRLFDLGGDKPLGGFGVEERNPFLGLRGIRLLLAMPVMLRIQVRALLRAAALGPLKVLLPMVTFPGEVEDTRRIFEEEAAGLADRHIAISMPAIGMMVEVPAAALTLDMFTSADFFSLGTNDLTQYLAAAGRDNPTVVDLYRHAEPALLRLIAQAVTAAHDMDKPIGICGDLAGNPAFLPALIASGIRRISVAPTQLQAVRMALAQAGMDG